VEDELLAHSVRAVDALGADLGSVQTIITSSLYSPGCPTIAHRLVDHYGLSPSVDKYHVSGVGCASAVPLMRLALQARQSHPEGGALVIAAESMSSLLTPARPEDPKAKTIGAAIFGDGCAAALLEAGEGTGGDGPGGDGTSRNAEDGAPATGAWVGAPAIVASKVHQVPGSLDAVRMQLSAEDGYLHLVRELPDIAAEGLGELVDDFLAGQAVERAEVDRWLLHPGGRRIIESLQEGLGLSREQAQSSFDVLAEHGNIGTPAIFYVMERSLRERRPAPGERAMMVTVGPGVSVGLMLLRW
jgi:alkylresorcinol/alkylpyrone synthase